MRKGSITPYLALTFAVLLSLILVCLSSAGYACGRAVLSAGMGEGLFSPLTYAPWGRIVRRSLVAEHGL